MPQTSHLANRAWQALLLAECACIIMTLFGCTATPTRHGREAVAPSPAPRQTEAKRDDPGVAQTEPSAEQMPEPKRPGGYYLDDGPQENPPPNLEKTPDAVPREEQPQGRANQPYIAFGQRYVPDANARQYKARGLASWYGKRFHGKPTASGEVYDMYQMTAAHPVLPIPSYARVTNLANGRSVIVRVNDRGPFRRDRVIDLSYTAALKLGYVDRGSTQVEVELVRPATAGPMLAKAAGAATAATIDPTTPAMPASGNRDGASIAAKSAGRGEYFLQLGAFAAQSSAEAFRDHIQKEIQFLSDTVQVLFKDGLFRVRLGPYATSRHARTVASRIERATRLLPSLAGP